MSGHADREGLLTWAAHFDPKPQKVFVVHGQDEVTDQFAATLHEKLCLDAAAPYPGAVYDFARNAFTAEGERQRITRAPQSEGGRRQNSIYARLCAAGQRLAAIIRRSEGLANKQLARFADQLEALCDRWDS